MANLTEQMESKANGMARTMSDKAQNLGHVVEKASHNLGARVGEVASDVSEKAADYVDSTRQYVKGNPIQSVAIAAAAGIAVGSLLTLAARTKH